MRTILTAIFCCFISISWCQEIQNSPKTNFIIAPEVMAGVTAEANENFPDRDPQLQALLNFTWDHQYNPTEWARRLKGPRTGISLGYTDFNNADSLGGAISIMPFLEFGALRSDRFKILVGMGGSYFTKIYDPITNPNNQAITTDLVWSFRAFMKYRILSGDKVDWRAGLGYFHHSNGHTRLPNQGLNSFLVSLTADIKNNKDIDQDLSTTEPLSRSMYEFVSARAAYGINVLGKPDPFNDKKPVYTVAAEYGRVYNNTWKWSAGLYYRYYEHYYDYIDGNESLVQDGREFADLRDNPRWNASALGISGSGELLLNHVGLELQLGLNIHKPAYKIDWRINQGWSEIPREIPAESNIVLGEFGTKFNVKHILASRMGLKYYLWGTAKQPKNNIYVAFHINANGGQADFTDVSLGYVYNFNFRER